MIANDLMQAIQQAYSREESQCLDTLIPYATLPKEALTRIEVRAREWVEAMRRYRMKDKGIEAFLSAFDLSSQEGIALMCLAEALLRVPDTATIDKLIKDKMTLPSWEQHLGKNPSWFVNAATWGLMLTGKLLNEEETQANVLVSALKRTMARASEPMIRKAVLQAMKILGQQFVMGETIESAMLRAKEKESKGYRYSYDMLGESAKTMIDAKVYYEAYQSAIESIGKATHALSPIEGPGISIKLTALHPRYEWVNRERIYKELFPKLRDLLLLAKNYNIGITIDAEEADRLELSLGLMEALVSDSAIKGFQGLGLAIQAYQKRAIFVVNWLIDLAKRKHQPLMVRLVKGAYWDSEIKYAQERGLKDYPVFTRKVSTDVSFIACAKKLLSAKDLIYSQLATHNAETAAYMLELAERSGNINHFEFQCLHGMGDALYDNIVGREKLNLPCRIYAPVGTHQHLLAYLVRRLLENGANTSFVNRIVDASVPVEALVADPVAQVAGFSSKPHPKIPLPANLYGPTRPNSLGVDLSNALETTPLLHEVAGFFPTLFEKGVTEIGTEALNKKFEIASQAFDSWSHLSPQIRADHLRKVALIFEKKRPELLALLIREAGKTVQDAISEYREAIDFCNYYAAELEQNFTVKILQGPTGEHNQLSYHGRGVMVCISPWNFPLAIFVGQIAAALAAGNTVLAKPASQTPLIAAKAVALMHEAGIPKEVLQLVIGKSSVLGMSLVQHPVVKGVMLTGSTETAQKINQALAERPGPLTPFIAETGGQNAMIVDSTALPEQVVTDVLMSAFNSAGQRCSALRLLLLQEDVADEMIRMLKGAMMELKIGDPFELATDLGPMIDKNAVEGLLAHVAHLEENPEKAQLIYECPLPKFLPELPRGVFFAPRVYEIEHIHFLKREVFGPILHVYRYPAQDLPKVLAAINDLGYGLTLGIHTRINERVDYIHRHLRIGNTYVNRNMIGAVVGVQPFGGEGLSGTGPKAGGPNMLKRLAIERTLSINTTASGGNVTLISLKED